MKRWSAWIPIAMSLAALAVIAFHIAFYGTAREPDEGPAAHIWQLLMAGQAPVILFFLFQALPESPAPALRMLAVQIGAALAAMAPVFYYHW